MTLPITRHLHTEPLDKRTVLREHLFFRGLDASIIDQLALRSITRRVKKGTVLFRKGDSGSRLYAVLTGLVRISAPSVDGKDTIFNLIVPGEVFGEIAVLDDGMRTADAITDEDCELLVIERRDFMPILRQFPDLAIRFIEVLCARLRRTSGQVEDIVFLDLEERLAKVLLLLHSRANSASPKGITHVTQREISQMVGASRESTNRQLRKWQRMKFIKLERNGVVVLAADSLARLISNN